MAWIFYPGHFLSCVETRVRIDAFLVAAAIRQNRGRVSFFECPRPDEPKCRKLPGRQGASEASLRNLQNGCDVVFSAIWPYRLGLPPESEKCFFAKSTPITVMERMGRLPSKVGIALMPLSVRRDYEAF